MRPLKIVIADDHGLMLEAIKLALEHEADLEVVGEAESGSELLPLIGQAEPDVVVLDLQMPGIDGVACIKLIRQRFPLVRTMVLSAYDSDDMIKTALDAGADAFISKSVDPAELAGALRRAVARPVAKAIGRASQVHPAVAEKGLSKRELEVLAALAVGKSNKEIAQTLWLAPQTVKFHLTSIYRKLDVTSRTQAVNWAYRQGLVEVTLDPSALQSVGHTKNPA